MFRKSPTRPKERIAAVSNGALDQQLAEATKQALDGKSDDEVRAVMGNKFPKRKRVV